MEQGAETKGMPADMDRVVPSLPLRPCCPVPAPGHRVPAAGGLDQLQYDAASLMGQLTHLVIVASLGDCSARELLVKLAPCAGLLAECMWALGSRSHHGHGPPHPASFP